MKIDEINESPFIFGIYGKLQVYTWFGKLKNTFSPSKKQ